MGTLLKFLLLALAVVWLWHSPALRGRPGAKASKASKASKTAKDAQGGPPSQTPPAPSAGAGQVDTIVACVHCGLHLPSNEAVRNTHGQVFCSTTHRDQHR